jgi:hypothetical protein
MPSSLVTSAVDDEEGKNSMGKCGDITPFDELVRMGMEWNMCGLSSLQASETSCPRSRVWIGSDQAQKGISA